MPTHTEQPSDFLRHIYQYAMCAEMNSDPAIRRMYERDVDAWIAAYYKARTRQREQQSEGTVSSPPLEAPAGDTLAGVGEVG